MLAADKDRLIANVKQNALLLRQRELEYYVERYSNLATQSSIIAGFAFDGLVELDPAAAGPHDQWLDSFFYAAGSLTMAFALYTLCIASFATVYGHRLALQGPTGSVERAVAVMMKSRNSIFISFACAMVCLMTAASAMAWVKMGYAAAGVTFVFVALFFILVYKYESMKHDFRIDPVDMVRGDVRLQMSEGTVDISQLETGFGGSRGAVMDRATSLSCIGSGNAPTPYTMPAAAQYPSTSRSLDGSNFAFPRSQLPRRGTGGALETSSQRPLLSVQPVAV